jgi:hypothetical protein
MASKKQVVPAAGKSVTGWADRVKQAASKQSKSAEFMGGGSNWISFKGGLIQVNGGTSPDGRLNCVVLGYMQERAWYEQEYDGANPQAPNCYAYGDDEGREPVEPHEKSRDTQHDTCRGCPHDEWGSANKGRGKACRQSVRLALVPATPEGVEGAVYFAKIPPTSIKNVRGWLQALGDTPCFAVVTEIQVRPSADNMFDVLLAPKAEVPMAFQSAILGQLDKAEADIRQPYPEFDDKPVQKPAKGGRRGKF